MTISVRSPVSDRSRSLSTCVTRSRSRPRTDVGSIDTGDVNTSVDGCPAGVERNSCSASRSPAVCVPMQAAPRMPVAMADASGRRAIRRDRTACEPTARPARRGSAGRATAAGAGAGSRAPRRWRPASASERWPRRRPRCSGGTLPPLVAPLHSAGHAVERRPQRAVGEPVRRVTGEAGVGDHRAQFPAVPPGRRRGEAIGAGMAEPHEPALAV